MGLLQPDQPAMAAKKGSSRLMTSCLADAVLFSGRSVLQPAMSAEMSITGRLLMQNTSRIDSTYLCLLCPTGRKTTIRYCTPSTSCSTRYV